MARIPIYSCSVKIGSNIRGKVYSFDPIPEEWTVNFPDNTTAKIETNRRLMARVDTPPGFELIESGGVKHVSDPENPRVLLDAARVATMAYRKERGFFAL